MVDDKKANPTPIGFCAFSLTLFVYSMTQAGATINIDTSPAMGMGLALFYGGLIELIAGIYELRRGDNYHALTFCSYAGFWFGLGSLYVSGSFAFTAQVTAGDPRNHAFAIFFLAWTIFTLIMLITSIRSNVFHVVFFASLLITYVLFTASYYSSSHTDLRRAAGAFGILTSAVGWYIGYAYFMVKGENSYFELPLVDMPTKGQKKPVEVN